MPPVAQLWLRTTWRRQQGIHAASAVASEGQAATLALPIRLCLQHLQAGWLNKPSKWRTWSLSLLPSS